MPAPFRPTAFAAARGRGTLHRNVSVRVRRNEPKGETLVAIGTGWAAGAAGMLAALALAGCGEKEAPRTSGVDTANFDPSVSAADDFYQYVNGTWLETVEIPPDFPTIGSFLSLHIDSENERHAILEELAGRTDLAEGTAERKVADYYATFMDEAAIEALGVEPVREELARIAAIASRDELLQAFGRNWMRGIAAPIAPFRDADFDDATKYLLTFTQSGLGLPDRDYYLREDPSLVHVRDEYRKYLAKLFDLAGVPDGAAQADAVYALEKRMAEKQWPLADVQDVDKISNRYAVAQLSTISPRIEWAVMLDAAGLSGVQQVCVTTPTYFTAFADLVAETDLATWKSWLTAKLLADSAPNLTAAFVQTSFEFNGRVLSGSNELSPRWKRGVRQVEAALGEAIGRIWVERHFPPEAKARMQGLVTNLMAAMQEKIDDLEWMGPETKARAHEKLAAFKPYVGYPDEWIDYAKLEVVRGDHVGNAWRAAEFEFRRQMDKLDEPVDRDEWGMTPQTVNAYYNPNLNKIVFPAAILRPPFFDMAADDAVNYGGIGVVIGHEISHGFDDQGRKFDGAGNKRDWWSEADNAAFMKRANALAAQYDQYVAIDSLHVNGQLTLGEDIGDLSGMAIAYRAYRNSLGGKPAPVIDGLTGEQRFFMGWAQVWREKSHPEYLRMLVLSDEHPPGRFRVNGVVCNMPEFYEAFGVKPGDGLWREPGDRVAIW